MKELEIQIQNTILTWLWLQKEFWGWRQNAGAIPLGNGRTGFRRRGRFERVGLPDIMGFWGKHGLYIEVKRPKEKPTPEQLEFLQQAESRGHIAMVAYSLDDVISRLKPEKPRGQWL